MTMGHSAEANTLALLTEIISVLRTGHASTASDGSKLFVSGDIRLDARRRAVFRGEEPVSLAPREYELFLALALHDGAAVSRSLLLREVWKEEVDKGSRTLCQHVVELRRKLEKDPARPECIVTIRKFGYRVVGEWVEERAG